MAKLQLDFHHNTTDENKSILLKLRRRKNKIYNKTADQWTKLFHKLNNKNNYNNTNSHRKKQQNSNKTCPTPVTQQHQSSLDAIYGPIHGFPSGYWWGIRMDCSRDQVHSPFNKDIQEGPFGVTSICTSHLNTTNDVDFGTLLTFTGAEYTSENINHPLVHNYRDNIPLRLVRSYNLVNEFAPKTGYRYDGLYIVISSWIGVSLDSKKYHKFALARLNHQEPPSWWPLQSTSHSQRISLTLRSSNTKAKFCTSLRCHMYNCHTHLPPMATTINRSSMRTANESTIVMRHVSKKCDTNVHGVESPVQIANLILPSSPKPTACKLQSTNISIRTELYDSSPNPQQEIKKTTPVTICRIYKTNHLPPAKSINNHSTNLVTTTNFNALGTCIKDKINQQSQIQLRTRISKLSDTSIVNSNSRQNNFNIKSEKTTPISDVSNKNIPLEYNSINNLCYSNEKVTKLKNNIEENLDSNLTSVERLVINSRRNSNTSSSSTDSLIKKLQLPEAVVTIETMTPEQLLNLIVKKRYNPTGKLLIGSIIGFPAENFTNDETFSKSSIDNPLIDSHTNNDLSKTQTTTPNFNDKLYKSSSTLPIVLSKKIQNQNNDTTQRLIMQLKHSRVTKALDPTEKSNIIQGQNSLRQLKKVHTNDKILQPFSKSTTMKKRRGELANLIIDANFTTKIRNYAIQTRTMTKRLRSPTIILRKRKEFKGFITNYTKFDLSKSNKALKSAKKTNILKNRQLQRKKYKEPAKNIHHDFTKSIATSDQINHKCKQKNAVLRKKKINCEKIQQSNSQMADAMIQCSLQNQTFTTNNNNSCDNNFNSKSIKIELIDLVDSDNNIKFTGDNNQSTNKIVRHQRQITKFSINSQIPCTKITKKQTISDRDPIVQSNIHENKCSSINNSYNNLSAFAPVNLMDGDLRIARLRSIGFKPIEPCLQHNNETLHIYNSDCSNIDNCIKPTVVRRDVDEQYNRYANAENNIVSYMDHELHYQDIEAEASGMQQKRSEKEKKKNFIKRNKPMKKTNRRLNGKSLKQQINGNNTDLDGKSSPWLGWNSYITER